MEALSFTMPVAHGGIGVAATGCGGKHCFLFFYPLFWFASVFLFFCSLSSLSLFLSFPVCSPLSTFFSCCLFFFLRSPFLCFLFLTFPLSLFFFLLHCSVPPLAFIARGCRRFLVTAGVHHSGEGCQSRDMPPDWSGSTIATKTSPLPLLPSRLFLRRQWIVLQETTPFQNSNGYFWFGHWIFCNFIIKLPEKL